MRIGTRGRKAVGKPSDLLREGRGGVPERLKEALSGAFPSRGDTGPGKRVRHGCDGPAVSVAAT